MRVLRIHIHNPQIVSGHPYRCVHVHIWYVTLNVNIYIALIFTDITHTFMSQLPP